MNALTLLKDDHSKLKKLLKEGEKKESAQDRRSMLSEIAHEFRVHEKIEEEIFYPALKEHPKAREIVLEGYQEHHVADVLVAELKQMDPADERWGAKFKVLKESLEHHIEEEEGHMFRTARSVLGRDRLEDLGRRMQAMNGTPRKPTR
jgi:hypothetical protein